MHNAPQHGTYLLDPFYQTLGYGSVTHLLSAFFDALCWRQLDIVVCIDITLSLI